jgi:uncharacterized protein YbjT (DUF2867 family)
MSAPTLVFGATGTHGGAVAGALLDAGEAVTAFVRDPRSERALALERHGARLAVGDLDDAASVTRALADVEAAYAVTTPFQGGTAEELRQGAQIIASATQARLPWLILASVASAADADVPHFRSKARIDQALRRSALAWTVVAPSCFYESVLGSRDAISEGRLPLPLPSDTPLQQVALEDLAALVTVILSRRAEHIGERVEVAGDSPTPGAMARELRRVGCERRLEGSNGLQRLLKNAPCRPSRPRRSGEVRGLLGLQRTGSDRRMGIERVSCAMSPNPFATAGLLSRHRRSRRPKREAHHDHSYLSHRDRGRHLWLHLFHESSLS